MNQPTPVEVTAAPAAAFSDSTLPEWLLLAHGGPVTGRDGRTFINKYPHLVVSRFQDAALPIPLDWEHATHIAAPQGQRADAAGWVETLQARDDGSIWGRVRWTEAGAAAVRSRAYRFYSPAYHLDKDKAIVGIPSVGLTNKPNLKGLALNRLALAPLPPMSEDFRRIAAAFGNTPETLARYAPPVVEYHRSQDEDAQQRARIMAAFGNTQAILDRYGK